MRGGETAEDPLLIARGAQGAQPLQHGGADRHVSFLAHPGQDLLRRQHQVVRLGPGQYLVPVNLLLVESDHLRHVVQPEQPRFPSAGMMQQQVATQVSTCASGPNIQVGPSPTPIGSAVRQNQSMGSAC